MSKKRKRTNYNNIDELHVDIDYEKLAEAIAEGNETRNRQYSASREWMKFIIHLLLWGIVVCGGIVCIACFIYGVKTLYALGQTTDTSLWWTNIARAFAAIIVAFFLLTLCSGTIIMSKEVDKEDDKQYIASIFSNTTALIALIIAIVALIK